MQSMQPFKAQPTDFFSHTIGEVSCFHLSLGFPSATVSRGTWVEDKSRASGENVSPLASHNPKEKKQVRTSSLMPSLKPQ